MILQLFILFLIVLVGGAIGLYSDGVNKQYLKSALAFSASFILGITVLHLIPMVYIDFEFSYGMWILGGFFVQIFLETLSSGVEHGHIHSKKGASKSWALQILLGLSFHAFIEGMPLLEMHGQEVADHGHHHDDLGSWHYFLSLILHKAPAAYALVLLLKHSGFQRSFVLTCLIVFGLMSPVGALFIQAFEFSEVAFKSLMAFVIGAFLHIATTIMFETESGSHHHISFRKVAFSLLGIGAAVLAEMI